MQETELEKAVNDFTQSLFKLIQVVNKKAENLSVNADKPAEPQKEKPAKQETKAESQPEETSGPTFKEVSNAYFTLLDRISEELSPEKAQANAIKLVNKYCGGEPISKDTLKPENFESLLADIEKCNQAMDERKNGK